MWFISVLKKSHPKCCPCVLAVSNCGLVSKATTCMAKKLPKVIYDVLNYSFSQNKSKEPTVYCFLQAFSSPFKLIAESGFVSSCVPHVEKVPKALCKPTSTVTRSQQKRPTYNPFAYGPNLSN